MQELKIDQRLLDSMSGISYIIDREYIIRAYSKPNWDQFATKNNGQHLVNPDKVIGVPVFDFFEGDKIKWYYKKVFDRIFEKVFPSMSIDFQCDSPEIKREGILQVTPIPNPDRSIDYLLVQSIITDSRVRPLSNIHSNRKFANVSQIIVICSMCKLINWPSETENWVTTEEYYQKDGTDNVNISHGLCPVCNQRFLDQLGM